MAASDEAAAAAREVRNSTEPVADMEHVEAMECQEARALTPTERDKELEQLKALLVEKQQELREAQQRAEQAERACARASENPQADKERCIPEWALAAAELERLDQGRVRAIFEEADEFIR
ncbi:unnamed protein product [Heligmosomoides polygyrus]|uniref:UVR domain-containing protein n=1 Tax=Heligmosomoides polygyrus TaxID=6339 RepID=A0A183FZZ1_HELPZ|nr:unnamed protein product [Heligmosomoides polygyrus]